MATLEGQTQAASFKDLLQVSNNNSGIDIVSRPIEDGEGTTGPFEVSTTQTKFTQKMLLNGNDLFLDVDADSKFITSVDDVLTLQLQGQSLFEFNGSVASAVNGLRFDASALTNDTSINSFGNDANISIDIAPKGAGTVNLGGGLTIAGGADTIAAYDVGTFTPTLGASVADGVHTYIAQTGQFIRIGNLIWFSIFMNISALDVAISGNLIFRGLPFSASDIDAVFMVVADDITFPANVETLFCRPVSVGTNLFFAGVRGNGTSGVSIASGDINGTTPQFRITGTYRTA